MKESLERLRGLARSGLTSARAGLGHARAFAAKAWATGRVRAREGWISFRDSWTKKDWMAGIEPLPPGMASNLTAIAIVTGLVVTSLVYGDDYHRRSAEARLYPSGEHPSQQLDAPPETAEPDPDAVPTPDTPEAAPAPSAATGLPQMGEAFVERFDRASISDRWSISHGWSNGSWMLNDWQSAATEVKPGLLTLHLKPGVEGSDFPLSGGEIQTLKQHRYGYFEARMKVPRGSGLVTGLFSYVGRDGRVRPNEIDIEILGRNTRVVELTIHENGQPTSKKITLPFDAADGFHTYGFDWQPDFVRWYADGQLIYTESGPAARRVTRPQQLILSVWGSKELEAWVGKIDLKRAPWKLEVSCVAYAPSYSGPVCE